MGAQMDRDRRRPATKGSLGYGVAIPRAGSAISSPEHPEHPEHRVHRADRSADRAAEGAADGVLAALSAQQIVELAPDAILIADADGTILLINRQTEVLFGYARQELLGHPVEALLPERLGPIHTQHRSRYAAAPRTRPMGATLTLWGRRKDGSEFPVEVSLSPLAPPLAAAGARDESAASGASGAPGVSGIPGASLVIATIRDISEQQRVEAARAATEAANRELRQVLALTDTALSHLALDDLLRELLMRVQELMGVDNVAILLVDEDAQFLRVLATRGLEEGVASPVSVPLGQGFAGRIAATRAPLAVEDLSTFPVVSPFLREKLRSAVGVPLLAADRLVGVVHVGSAVARSFSADEVRLLQLVGERIALAIDRAQLYTAEQTARKDAEAARRAAEIALARTQASEARFRRLVEAGTIGIVVAGASIIEANDAFLQMVGYAPADVVAGTIPWRTLAAPEYAEVTARAITELLATGTCTPFETAFVRRDGSQVPALVGAALLEREPPQVVAYVVDLTERKWLEREREEARASELAVREVTQHMDEFLATASHDLRNPVAVLQGNAQLALRRFERLKASLVASPAASLAAQGSTMTMPPEQAEQTDSGWSAVGDQAGLAGEPVVESARERRRRMSRMSRMSHTELEGQPPVGGQAERSMKALGATLVQTERSADTLKRMVTLLFDLSRARTGQLELDLALCDLADLVRMHVQAQRIAVPGRVIRLELPDPDTGAVVVLADADRLAQVLSNYLTNALKYSADDRPVEVRLEVAEGLSVVSVQDAGPGLPWEEQSRVWELFHRAPGVVAQGSGMGGSLGLGLHICKQLIKLHRGRVGVESVVGEGATFYFTLPLAGTSASAPPPAAQTAS